MWLKIDKLDAPLLERKGLYSLYLSPMPNNKRSQIKLCVKETECFVSSYGISPLSWQHIAVVYKYEKDLTGYVHFWVNGVKDAATEVPIVPLTDDDIARGEDTPLIIGANSELNNFFKGNIDDISLWKTAVNDKIGKNMVYDVFAGIEEGLSAYWSFNRKGDVMEDIKGLVGKEYGGVSFPDIGTKPLITVHPFL